MPIVLRVGPYRFFFYAGDRGKPRHIHIERDGRVANFWLEPLRLARSGGINQRDINRIRRIAEENLAFLIEEWNDYFDD